MKRNILLLLLLSATLSNCKKKPVEEDLDSDVESTLDTATIDSFEQNVIDTVYFGYDNSNIDSDGEAVIARQADWLKNHSDVTVVVEGHCDDRGTREYNLALGERRANAAAQTLKSHGIAGDKIEIVSYGKERPAVLGNDESAYSKNRRAVTVPK